MYRDKPESRNHFAIDSLNRLLLEQSSVFVRLKKKNRQQQKEERSREEDRRDEGNQTGSNEFQETIRSFKMTSFKRRI